MPTYISQGLHSVVSLRRPNCQGLDGKTEIHQVKDMKATVSNFLHDCDVATRAPVITSLFQAGKRKIGCRIKADGTAHCIKKAKDFAEISSKTFYLCFIGQNSVP